MKVKSIFSNNKKQCYCGLPQALVLPQWQHVKMLAEDLREERKFCRLTSVHSRTARLEELSDTQ